MTDPSNIASDAPERSIPALPIQPSPMLRPETPDGEKKSTAAIQDRINVWALIAGTATGALGLLLTIAIQPPAVFLRFLLLGLTVVAIGWMFLPRLWQAGIAALVAVSLAITTGVVFINPSLLQHKAEKITVTVPGRTVTVTQTPTLTPSATPTVQVTVISPVPNADAAINGCVHLMFKADPPDGWALAVGTQGANDPDFYFEAQVTRNPSLDEWAADISMGDSTSGRNDTYQTMIIMGPQALITYLKDSRPEPDATWWAGAGVPPGAIQIAAFQLRRDNVAKLTC
jgi:hypothetical protein